MKRTMIQTTSTIGMMPHMELLLFFLTREDLEGRLGEWRHAVIVMIPKAKIGIWGLIDTMPAPCGLGVVLACGLDSYVGLA